MPMPKGATYKRRQTRLREYNRAQLIHTVLHGEKLYHDLQYNRSEIMNKGKSLNYTTSKIKKRIEEEGIPYYNKEQFFNKYKTHKNFEGWTNEMIDDEYDLYSLYVASIITGHEEERKLTQFLDTYVQEAEKTKNQDIIDIVHRIAEQGKDKILDIIRYKKLSGGDFRKILPTIQLFYEVRDMKDSKQISDTYEDLITIAQDFGIDISDLSTRDAKYINTQHLLYDTYNSLKHSIYTRDEYVKVKSKEELLRTNSHMQDFYKVYRRMNKQEKLDYAKEIDINSDTYDMSRLLRDYIYQHSNNISYTKKGKPYLRGKVSSKLYEKVMSKFR